jgi:hypothetical protein
VAHHHRGGPVETLDQEAALIVDRRAERAGDPPHAALAQPGLGRTQQGRKHVRLVDGVEEPKVAGGVVVPLEVAAIDLSTDPPDRP